MHPSAALAFTADSSDYELERLIDEHLAANVAFETFVHRGPGACAQFRLARTRRIVGRENGPAAVARRGLMGIHASPRSAIRPIFAAPTKDR